MSGFVWGCLLSLTGVSSGSGAAVIAFNNWDALHPVYYREIGTVADAGCYVTVLGGPDANHLSPVYGSQGTQPTVLELDGGLWLRKPGRS